MYNLIKYIYSSDTDTSIYKFKNTLNKTKYVVTIFDNLGVRTTMFLLNDINCLDFKEFNYDTITIELSKNIDNYYLIWFDCFITNTEIYIEE